MNGIITIPLVPIRESDDERSELFSQLLFGECVEILEFNERWLFIRNINDNHKGWVDRKMVQILSETEDKKIAKSEKYFVQVPLILCNKTTSDEKMFLPGGSIMHGFDNGKCTVGNETYVLDNWEMDMSKEISGK